MPKMGVVPCRMVASICRCSLSRMYASPKYHNLMLEGWRVGGLESCATLLVKMNIFVWTTVNQHSAAYTTHTCSTHSVSRGRDSIVCSASRRVPWFNAWRSHSRPVLCTGVSGCNVVWIDSNIYCHCHCPSNMYCPPTCIVPHALLTPTETHACTSVGIGRYCGVCFDFVNNTLWHKLLQEWPESLWVLGGN